MMRNMRIDKLLRTTIWTERTLAKAVGSSQFSINRLRRGVAFASANLAVKIERATKKGVRVGDVPMSAETRDAVKYLRRVPAKDSA